MIAKRLRCVLGLTLIALSAHAQGLDPSWLKEFRWRELGPAVFGGRIVDLALVPGESFGILAATASGGLWQSRNNGTSWECIFQHEAVISIGAIAVDPGRPEVIWIGSGEGNNQRSSYWGNGVYKTVDGGKTWANQGLRGTQHIGRIAVDPKHPDTVWVAALGALYTQGGERGVFKTIDGGVNWQCVLDLGPSVGASDLQIDPEQPDTVFVASYERLRRPWNFAGASEHTGIYRTTDGGTKWERLSGGLPQGKLERIGLALVPGKAGALYAVIPNENPRPEEPTSDAGFSGKFESAGYVLTEVAEEGAAAEAGLRRGDVLLAMDSVEIVDVWSYVRAFAAKKAGDTIALRVQREKETLDLLLTLERHDRVSGRTRVVGGEIWYSEDRGTNWVKKNEKPVVGDPPYYYGQIRVDPHDPEHLYVLGVPLYESKDGGKTWKADGARTLHVDHHALVFDPALKNRILLGNDGGFAQSYDGGRSWDWYDNLPIAQFYAIGFDMRRPYHVYGGTQDNGTWGGPSRKLGGVGREDWYSIGGGDGFYAQVDPRDHRTVYGESQFGALYRVDLESGSSNSIQPRPKEGESEYRFNWNSPVLLSRHNSEIVYFGGNRLFKSLDRGENWPIISPDLTTNDSQRLEGNVPHCTITTIAESAIDPNLLLVGTDDGLVQRSTDGGLSWTNLTGRFPAAEAGWWVSRVVLSAHRREVAYASFTGYREDDFRPVIYMTENCGENWRPIQGDLPQGPVNVVCEDPQNGQILWAGTEFGAYFSYDQGQHWHRLAEGLPTIAVHDLAVHPRDREVVLGTHGRGIYILEVAALQELAPEILAKPVHLYDVADALLLERGPRGAGWQGDRVFRASNPQEGAWLSLHLLQAMEKDALELQILDASGTLVQKLEAPLAAGFHRLRWDLRRDRIDDEGRRRPGARVEAGQYTVLLRQGESEQRKSFHVARAGDS